MKRASLIGLFAAPVITSYAIGEAVPFTDGRWEISARDHRIERHLDQDSLYLETGIALVRDSEFRNGIIEFDIAVPNERGFVGVLWRAQDAKNFEEFYIRPHQSGNPDANQYTPAHGGLTAWQLYHGPGYGEPTAYRHDQWMHVKIVVSGDQAEVYLDSDEPNIFIPDLKRDDTPGMVGLNAFTCPARYANFSFEAMDQPPELRGEAPPDVALPEGVVAHWQVSSGFAESELQDVLELDAEMTGGLEWTALESESTGITNLAQVQDLSRETNTVFAKLVLNADSAGLHRIWFGYSDRVRVFAGGRLVYAGTNGYRSRDYRYLGSIGFFDEICVPLDAGRNEIWFAVSESFGGWGIMARLQDSEGVEVEAE